MGKRSMQKHSDWLAFAQDDLKAAEVLLNAELGTIATFHTQQSAEKALKAFLLCKKISFKKIHDLVVLIDLCSTVNQTFLDFAENCAKLDPYITQGRYPYGNGNPSRQTVLQAISYADKILKKVETELSSSKRS